MKRGGQGKSKGETPNPDGEDESFLPKETAPLSSEDVGDLEQTSRPEEDESPKPKRVAATKLSQVVQQAIASMPMLSNARDEVSLGKWLVQFSKCMNALPIEQRNACLTKPSIAYLNESLDNANRNHANLNITERVADILTMTNPQFVDFLSTLIGQLPKKTNMLDEAEKLSPIFLKNTSMVEMGSKLFSHVLNF